MASIRDEIKSIISAIIPLYEEEQQHMDQAREWIDSGAELFRKVKPDQPDTHLVSYFMLLDPEAQECLLVDHKKAGLWLPTGGHVEVDEHPKETVKREAFEELGIEAEFLSEGPNFLTITKTRGASIHTDVSLWYILKGKKSIPLTFDPEEYHQIRWFKSCNIPYDRTDPHMRRFISKVLPK